MHRRAVLRLLFVLAVLVGLTGACHHDAAAPIEPAAPGEKPPLPPASGTPIGFLLDDSSLKLSDDQATKLREIDTGLSARLESIDAQTRAANRPPEEAAPWGGGGRHGGGMGGGMGGGGMGGGGMGGGGMGGGGRGGGMGGGMGGNNGMPPPSGGGGRHRKNGGGSGAAGGAATVNRLADERNADVKDALTRAFAILDPSQQVTAKKVLSDHDVDLDVGSTAATTVNRLAPGEPGGEANPPPEP